MTTPTIIITEFFLHKTPQWIVGGSSGGGMTVMLNDIHRSSYPPTKVYVIDHEETQDVVKKPS